MVLVHLFVCFVCVSFCHVSLPVGVVGWLLFVIVALPGLFYYCFINIPTAGNFPFCILIS